MSYSLTDFSATEIEFNDGLRNYYYKKCYCSVELQGEYIIFTAHRVENNAFRQQWSVAYSDFTSPTGSAAVVLAAIQTIIDSYAGGGTGVTSVTATSPITSSGGATPNISTNINKNKLVGRNPVTAGVMEEISIGSGLNLSGTTLSANVSGSITKGTAAGTDTYTTTITGVTGYADGDCYLIRFTNGNTTGATININGLGAVNLYRNNDGPVIGGDIQALSEMLIVYNATTSAFQCIGTSPNTIIAYVTNDDSVTITKGQPVYAFSGTGDRMTVKRANNTTDATSAQTVGLVFSSSIAANQKGFIMLQGLLDGLSTLPTSTWADGDAVFLGATAGSITKIKPYAPNHLVYLGFVTTASPGSAGRMYVRVQNGYELDELHNVQAQTPSNKDTIYFDSADSQWKTASLATILGFTPVASTRTISTTSPLSGGGDLSANRTLAIADAAADGTTKGAATFNASDFNSASGLVSLDYTNGQAASASAKGFLTSADWTTFNSKGNGTVTSVAALTLGTSGTDLGSSVANGSTTPVITLNVPTASATNRGVLSSADWSTFNGKQNALSLTTTGTSGAATLVGSTLNIPQYSGGGGSGLTRATWLTTIQALGSAIKCEPVCFGHGSQLSTTSGLQTQVLNFWAVYVPVATTITGVMYYITNGNSVSTVTTGFNGMGLYTLSGTTLTRVAVTADAVANWRSGGAANTQKIPFTATYSAAAGVYYIGLLACITGTLPSVRSALAGSQALTWGQYDLINVFTAFQVPAQTTMPTSLTAGFQQPITILGSYLY